MNPLDEARQLQRKLNALIRKRAQAHSRVNARFDEKDGALIAAASPAARRVLLAAGEPAPETLDLTADDAPEEHSADPYVVSGTPPNGNGRFSEHDEDPDLTQVPAALQRPYAPSERLVGKAREK